MKKNGFVFMETLIVISILTFTLMMLFSSYAYILSKSKERNTFDNEENLYKTYYIKKIIESIDTLDGYFSNNCINNSGISGKTSYVCNLEGVGLNNNLYQIAQSFEVDKIMYFSPNEILTYVEETGDNSWLLKFDASTIDYINYLGKSVGENNKKVLIIKYKKKYGKQDGEYEIYHSRDQVV